MAKYLIALLGAAFIVTAAGLSHAQTSRMAQQGATANEPMETRGERVTKKSTRKAKKAKKRVARRGMGMGQPTPPGTDRQRGTPDQLSTKPRMDTK